MFRLLKIILVFWCFHPCFAGDLQNNFKIFYPEYIPAGGQFEVSIIVSQMFPNADKLELYLIPDHSLTINKTQLWTSDGKLNIPFTSKYLDNFSVSCQKLSINLSDTATFLYGSLFQIVIELKSIQVTTNRLKIYGEFINDGEVSGYLFNSDQNLSTDETYLYSVTFNYFEKYSTAGSAAVFYPGSYLNMPIDYKFENILSSEFWIKPDRINSAFLKIIDQESNRNVIELALNENQMLITSSVTNNNLTRVKSVFISNNNWYHINLIVDKIKSELSLYCNDDEILKSEKESFINFDNLVLHISNESSSGNFSIEQIRLVKSNGSLSGISRNINYPDYSDDSSNVIFQINFLESELINLVNNRNIAYDGLKLIKSDAPIFPRAPIINVKPMNNYYEIEWTSGENNNVLYFIVERATDNESFSEVGKLAADGSDEKYSLITEKQNQSEIIYFRIKQIDKDGTIIYSDVVKVGQGSIDDVVLGQNFPNPFNPTTQIEFELLLDTDVELKIFNLAGKEIMLLHKGFLPKGIHQFKFDATGLPSGIYLYQISTPLSTHSQKMILAK